MLNLHAIQVSHHLLYCGPLAPDPGSEGPDLQHVPRRQSRRRDRFPAHPIALADSGRSRLGLHPAVYCQGFLQVGF